MKKFAKSKIFGILCILITVAAVIAGACVNAWFFTGAVSIAIGPLANLSQDDIEALAMAKLTDGFGGSPYENLGGSPYENMDGLDEDDIYDGSEDFTLSFIGAGQSFISEADGAVEVTYSINNNTSSAIYVALANGTLTDATILKNNFGADCYLKDGVMHTIGGKDVTGTGIGTVAGIDGFVKFSERNAFRVIHMVIQATNNSDSSVNTAAYNKTMIVRRFSPFRIFGEERINLFKFYSVQQQNKEKIEIPLVKYDIQRDDQTLIVMQIDAGVTLTVTETIGAIQNAAATLFKKATQARENIAKKTAGIMPARTLRVKRAAILKGQMSKTPQGRLAEIFGKLKKG